ncbi:peroxiredoxin [Aureococcus anophagefferens]|uniref:Peroxiredoxin n=1 Tax=Aureococcus anophagefferens TaxID=44056 RepID=A0ABR1FQI2_AURAN
MAAHLAMQAARRAAPAARRFIATGDAAAASGLSLQRARPWLNGDGPAGSDSSNQASDHAVPLADIFAGKRVAVFGVPAPFTGTCTEQHVPGYAALAGDFRAKASPSSASASPAPTPCAAGSRPWASTRPP